MKTPQNQNPSTANAPWNQPEFVNAKRTTSEVKKPMSFKKKAALLAGGLAVTAGLGLGIHAAGDRADNEGGKLPTPEQVEAGQKGLDAVNGTEEPAPTGVRTPSDELPPAVVGDSTTRNDGQEQVPVAPANPSPTETTQPNGQ